MTLPKDTGHFSKMVTERPKMLFFSMKIKVLNVGGVGPEREVLLSIGYYRYMSTYSNTLIDHGERYYNLVECRHAQNIM